MDEKLRKLRSESKLLSPKIIIGKNGVTAHTFTLISAALKRERLIKIKVLKTFLDESGTDRKALARELAERTGSVLVDQVGFMIVLTKK